MFGFKKRAEAKRHEENPSPRRRGYDSIAGGILRGWNIDSHIDNFMLEGPGSVEDGEEEAIRDWMKMRGFKQ